MKKSFLLLSLLCFAQGVVAKKDVDCSQEVQEIQEIFCAIQDQIICLKNQQKIFDLDGIENFFDQKKRMLRKKNPLIVYQVTIDFIYCMYRDTDALKRDYNKFLSNYLLRFCELLLNECKRECDLLVKDGKLSDLFELSITVVDRNGNRAHISYKEVQIMLQLIKKAIS